MTDPSTFGARLRAARVAAGLSQSQLARLCGIPKPRLSRYENDHIRPSLMSLERLAGAVGVGPDTLLSARRAPLDAFVDEVRAAGLTFSSEADARRVARELVGRKREAIAKEA